jgi:hypothetical protein
MKKKTKWRPSFFSGNRTQKPHNYGECTHLSHTAWYSNSSLTASCYSTLRWTSPSQLGPTTQLATQLGRKNDPNIDSTTKATEHVTTSRKKIKQKRWCQASPTKPPEAPPCRDSRKRSSWAELERLTTPSRRKRRQRRRHRKPAREGFHPQDPAWQEKRCEKDASKEENDVHGRRRLGLRHELSIHPPLPAIDHRKRRQSRRKTPVPSAGVPVDTNATTRTASVLAAA